MIIFIVELKLVHYLRKGWTRDCSSCQKKVGGAVGKNIKRVQLTDDSSLNSILLSSNLWTSEVDQIPKSSLICLKSLNHSFISIGRLIWIFVYALAAQISTSQAALNTKQFAKEYKRIIWEILKRSGRYFSIQQLDNINVLLFQF